MPDRKPKTKNGEKTRTKLKERGCQEKSEDATRGKEVEVEAKTSSQSASSRRQLDLFQFYKKRARKPGYLAHTTENRASTDLQTSADAPMNSETGKALDDDGKLRMDSAHSTGSVINDDATLLSIFQDSEMMSKPCTDIQNTADLKHYVDACANLSNTIPEGSSNALSMLQNARASEVTATEECINQNTDEGLIDQGQPNTSITPSIAPFKPIDQEVPTKCAALSQPPFLLSSQKPQLSFLLDRSPSLPSRSPLFLATDSIANNSTSSIVLNPKDDTNIEDGTNKNGIINANDLSSLDMGKRGMAKDELSSKKATLNSTISHRDTAIEPLVPSVPEPASEYGQVIEQVSEHGSEKEMRCDRLGTEEASESICTALQNVNANGPGVEGINAIKSIPMSDRLMERGESIIIPIDLTTSPRLEHGPLADIATTPPTRYESISLSQGDSLPNEIRASWAGRTNLLGTIPSHGKISSPILGSQEKPIEVEPLSPVTLKSSSHPQLKLSSSRMTCRKSKQGASQIHPFFQRATTTAAALAINSSRDAGRDVGLGKNLEPSSTGHSNQNFDTARSANFRPDVREGKGNKDKSSDEAQCDITGVVEGIDVMFSRSDEKKHFWDFISKSANSTSSSNAIRTTARSLPSVPSKTRALLTPWPNSENQHVLKSQRLAAKPSPFPRRMVKRIVKEIGVGGSLAERLGLNGEHIPFGQELVQPSLRIPSRSAIRDALKTIPNEHHDHPGIARVISVIKEIGRERRAEENADAPRDHSLWTNKWKPRRAVEVLGNESQALYLREWLRALSIQSLTPEKAEAWEKENIEHKKHKRKRKVEERSQKRRMVIRSIARTKRRRIGSEDLDEDTSWIVADDDEEEEIDEHAGGDEDDWLPDAGKSPGNDCNHREDFEKEFSRRLTNTILIVGKPGTGKTSAVYACAAELGWEIFEVYPGIGKRAGMNIAELVGSVGKNHMVGKGARQSIILLEEVDILFKEDINFWTSVVNIISTSHRPVILTCNDASIIPQGLLPLQKCLKFEACPCGLASSFLQAVCIAEGYDATRKRVEEEYALMGGDEPEWPPSVAFPSEALPSADLRSALNRLQMGLRFPVSQEAFFGNCAEWRAEEHTLKDCETYAESASYVDAYLDRIEQKPEFETQGDDEIGYTMLTNPKEYSFEGMQKTDFNNYPMACDALACCRHVVNVLSSKCKASQSQSEHHWLIQTRRLLARQAASFLDEIISLPGPLLPRHEAVLEYIPAARWLVALDDAQDVPPHSAVASRRRWRHVRYMDLSEEALSAVREYYDMFFPRCIT